jgi:hypothetical protein
MSASERQRVIRLRAARFGETRPWSPASVRAEWSGPDLAAQWSELAGVQGSPAIKRSVGGSGGAKPPAERTSVSE